MSPSRELLARVGHGLLELGSRYVVAALVLADVGADRRAAERVERHVRDRLARPVVVAEGVDVRRRVVRGDDHLGVERRPALGRVCVDDVAHDLRGREERVQLRLAGQGLRQVDNTHGYSFPAISRQTWTMRGTSADDDPLAGLGAGAGRVADDAGFGDVAEHVHRDDHLRAGVAHAVLAERRPLEPRSLDGGAAIPGVARSRDPSRPAGRARSRATSRLPRRGSSAPRCRASASAARSHHWTRKTRRPVVSK